jgi:1,4-dihydroxy-2-naphthoate octaprenyltransferase
MFFRKLKAHLLTLPRWFAAPYFGSALLLGAVMAGGLTVNSWIALVGGLFIMAGGHAFNSYLDYAWTGIDKGKIEDRSAEKAYTGGQNLLANNIVSINEVLVNAVGWYVMSLFPIVYLSIKLGWGIFIVAILGMLITFWYSWGKFNWTHELSLGVGAGPIAVLMGMFGTVSNPDIGAGILAGVPFAIILCFAGLALDEWPDAEANLRKGVKSIAYYVWYASMSLEAFLGVWFAFMYLFQFFLVYLGILDKQTMWTFILVPFFMALFVLLRSKELKKKTGEERFKKVAAAIVAVAALYPVLLLIGQLIGS